MNTLDERVENLVNLWMKRSIGNHESFGFLIGDYLSHILEGCSYAELIDFLLETKELSTIAILDYPEDGPLNLSYKEFTSALDSLILGTRNLSQQLKDEV